MIKELCCPRTNLNNDDRTTEARVTQGPGAASSDDWGQVSTRGQGNWSPIVDVLAQNLAWQIKSPRSDELKVSDEDSKCEVGW